MTSVTSGRKRQDQLPQATSSGQDADHHQNDQTTGKSSRLSLVTMVDISGLPLTGVGCDDRKQSWCAEFLAPQPGEQEHRRPDNAAKRPAAVRSQVVDSLGPIRSGSHRLERNNRSKHNTRPSPQ
jgi:hypothetical protein